MAPLCFFRQDEWEDVLGDLERPISNMTSDPASSEVGLSDKLVSDLTRPFLTKCVQ